MAGCLIGHTIAKSIFKSALKHTTPRTFRTATPQSPTSQFITSRASQRTFTTSMTFMDKEQAKVETVKGESKEQKDGHPSSHQAGEGTEGKHDWKKRAPYSIHEPNDKFNVKYEASCHCGRVKYQLSRDAPLDSKLCHCTTCQVQHAAPFQWAAIFHKDDINFVKGHHNLEWYDPSAKSIEHKLPCKVRCNFCHSPIMDEGRNMILLFPSLIKLENEESKKKFKPKCHMFYGQRVIDIPDGLPKWTGINNDSDLIEDSPPELVEEVKKKREKEKKEKSEDKDKEQK